MDGCGESGDVVPGTVTAAGTVLVTGGKGGVGKTTLSANLGLELARLGLRVLLVDLDLGLGNLHVVLGLSPRATIEDALLGGRDLSDCVVAGPLGLQLLPAGSGNPRMAEADGARRQALLADLRVLARGYDLVLCDGAPGIGPDVLAFAEAADHVLAVTTPDPSALTDAFGLIKALDRSARGTGLGLATPELVLNQVSGLDQARTLHQKLASVCERFLSRSPRLAGWLPRSTAIEKATVAQRPFVLASRTSLESGNVRRLAQRLARRCQCQREHALQPQSGSIQLVPWNGSAPTA